MDGPLLFLLVRLLQVVLQVHHYGIGGLSEAFTLNICLPCVSLLRQRGGR